jgi:hypothetical protein
MQITEQSEFPTTTEQNRLVLPGLEITILASGFMKLRAPNVLMFFPPSQVEAIKQLLLQNRGESNR